MEYSKAYFGGGCFWCLEAGFNMTRGVGVVTSGYAGGTVPNPSYEDVCEGTTGHAEVVEVNYDPGAVRYESLLTVFFALHDPTTLNRQGNDEGTQYRSVIFTQNEDDAATAHAYIEQLTKDGVFTDKIVTEVKPIDIFYPADKSHQRYFERNPDQAYCQLVVAPKVAKLRKEVAHLLRAQ
jgi:peptide-methionine (S)-S-oxide reductase